MSTAIPPNQDQIDTLISSVWQVLDDMGSGKGTACCMYAKAQLRQAYEPFNQALPANERADEDLMSMSDANEIIKNVEDSYRR